MDASKQYLMHTYKRFPIILRKGRGMKVWDSNGKEYLDFVGGIAVNNLGHCHSKVVIALQKQAQRLLHVSNLYHIEPQIELAKLLVKHSFADKVFFCNSGAEANEAAIKLTRKYAKDHLSHDRYEIITAFGSFHGRTLATLSASGQEKLQKGFEPLVPGFKHVPFNDINALKGAITKHTCAVMMEPIQGEAGIKMPDMDYLKEVRKVCDEYRLLFILDEVQTGMGRTGKLFAYEHFGIEPDIMSLAKGLGGGVAIGAMLAKDSVAASFQPGSHAATFGGNPLACAAAKAAMETLLEDGFILDNCERMSKYLINRLEGIKKDYPSLVAGVRGLGLMIGMEMTTTCGPIVNLCLEEGVLINCIGGNVLRFTPALTLTEKEVDRLIEVLEDVFEKIS
ncbi:acetylornithine aminotransferase [bacterium BMS3Abin10]|nr:acetylornithine aminotransferase [bacterium BMS3Abin10]GBE39275.1 acetylornithine aminotransferase [bacterium BMS3Bbin08]